MSITKEQEQKHENFPVIISSQKMFELLINAIESKRYDDAKFYLSHGTISLVSKEPFNINKPMDMTQLEQLAKDNSLSIFQEHINTLIAQICTSPLPPPNQNQNISKNILKMFRFMMAESQFDLAKQLLCIQLPPENAAQQQHQHFHSSYIMNLLTSNELQTALEQCLVGQNYELFASLIEYGAQPSGDIINLATKVAITLGSLEEQLWYCSLFKRNLVSHSKIFTLLSDSIMTQKYNNAEFYLRNGASLVSEESLNITAPINMQLLEQIAKDHSLDIFEEYIKELVQKISKVPRLQPVRSNYTTNIVSIFTFLIHETKFDLAAQLLLIPSPEINESGKPGDFQRAYLVDLLKEDQISDVLKRCLLYKNYDLFDSLLKYGANVTDSVVDFVTAISKEPENEDLQKQAWYHNVFKRASKAKIFHLLSESIADRRYNDAKFYLNNGVFLINANPFSGATQIEMKLLNQIAKNGDLNIFREHIKALVDDICKTTKIQPNYDHTHTNIRTIFEFMVNQAESDCVEKLLSIQKPKRGDQDSPTAYVISLFTVSERDKMLKICIEHHDVPTLILLLKNGVSLPNNILDICSENLDYRMLSLLLEYGAKPTDAMLRKCVDRQDHHTLVLLLKYIRPETVDASADYAIQAKREAESVQHQFCTYPFFGGKPAKDALVNPDTAMHEIRKFFGCADNPEMEERKEEPLNNRSEFPKRSSVSLATTIHQEESTPNSEELSKNAEISEAVDKFEDGSDPQERKEPRHDHGQSSQPPSDQDKFPPYFPQTVVGIISSFFRYEPTKPSNIPPSIADGGADETPLASEAEASTAPTPPFGLG
ncbi:MAG: hypothetical protein K0Q74_495 [Gammaproteobacteria bacterium]|jgi:hypothetical protein|nr:hypothetical protein [Gammaproteobacteria bacterium]